MKTRHQKLCTVILEYQNPQLTLATIASLRAASLPVDVKNLIVVVDNSPVPDGQLAKALKPYKNIHLIETHQNTGFAGGNNLGIRYGLKKKCDYFLLLNNDVLVDPGFIKALLEPIKKNADMVNPKIYFAKGYEYHQNRYKPSQLGKVIWFAGGKIDWDNVYSQHFGIDEVDRGQYNRQQEIDFANFCCLLLKKQVFETIGFLDEDYFLYWEDADFSTRAKQAGLIQIYQPKAVVWHKNSGSSGSGSRLHDYYLTRNRLLFGFRYAGFRAKFALFRESLRKIIFGRSGERQGTLDFYFRKFGKGSFL